MTIADAINYKDLVVYKRSLVSKIRSSLMESVAHIERENTRVDAAALELATAALGKDNVKISEGDVEAITVPFIKKNGLILVDPLKAKDRMEELTEEIDKFEAEVDAALSEINAITIIEV